MLQPRLRAALVAAILALVASSADAGVFDRLRKAGEAFSANSGQVVGTALTGPVRVNPGSSEVEVWLFSTTLGRSIERVRFPADDLPRVARDVKPGATVVVISASPVGTDGAILARTWRARPEGNPLRADFMDGNRDRILTFALRHDPATLGRIYASDRGALRQVALDVADLVEALRELGVWEEPAR